MRRGLGGILLFTMLFMTGQARAQEMAQEKKEVRVVLETSQGNIEIKLFPEVAPKTCENFVGFVNKGYYNGIVFHRVIKDFMVQGGDPTGTGRGGESAWGGRFNDEIDPRSPVYQRGYKAGT